MNMYKKVIALSALLSVACVSALTTVTPGQLTIGLNRYSGSSFRFAQNDNFLAVTAKTGNSNVYIATGFHVDVACAVARLLNLKPVFVWYDYAATGSASDCTCENALTNGKIDAFFTVVTAGQNCSTLNESSDILGVEDLTATGPLGFIFSTAAYTASPKNCDLQFAVQSAINYLSKSQSLLCYAVKNNANVATASTILPVAGVPMENSSTLQGFIPVAGSKSGFPSFGCATCLNKVINPVVSCLAQYAIDNAPSSAAQTVEAGTII